MKCRLTTLHHQDKVLEKLDLIVQQTKRRNQNRRIESQLTPFSDKHCQDLKKTRSHITYSHFPFVGFESGVIEVGRNQRPYANMPL
jgi:hypothetical protein